MAGYIEANPAAIAGYGTAAAGMATQVATAAGADQAASIAAAVPVFGLIGQEFLASFAFAQANHLLSAAQIAAVHAGTSVTAFEAAGAYEGNEAASAASLLGTVMR
ncbi:type VII secretion target [Nocardia terpenica]|nr:type VII secretion target [Nocardia terpenica]